MRHVLDTTGSREGLASALTECLDAYMPAGLLILAGGSNGFTPETTVETQKKVVRWLEGFAPASPYYVGTGTAVLQLP